MLVASCVLGTMYKYENVTPKVARNVFNIGRSGIQYVAMVTKPVCSNCGAHLVICYSKESNFSDTNWLRYRFFITFDQNLVHCMASSLSR